MIFGPQPVYPEEARANGVEGVIRIEAVIGVEGGIESATVIDGDPRLAPSALESVRKRSYRPTLLNGTPVEVVAEIVVRFGGSDGDAARPVAGKKR
ncbi:MAG TPA: energy transducer TonB [Bryobacteraceae bacterium]|nr:energy transducer TonB [Bryobacteraceae bacterium]